MQLINPQSDRYSGWQWAALGGVRHSAAVSRADLPCRGPAVDLLRWVTERGHSPCHPHRSERSMRGVVVGSKVRWARSSPLPHSNSPRRGSETWIFSQSCKFLTRLYGWPRRCCSPVLQGCSRERSGIFDIGLEGKMLIAAFFSAAFAYTTGNVWLGMLAGNRRVSGAGGAAWCRFGHLPAATN